MATASNIISKAFEKISVEVYTSAQETKALSSLNYMVNLLGADMMMYTQVAESFNLVVADSEYTIGSSGQWDTVRPMKVLRCFLRDGDSYDYPVTVMSSKDYNMLTNKSYSARPTELYFLPEYPLAKIIFNTAPDYAYAGYFEFLKGLSEFATTATTVSLPPEYQEALIYNLAVSLAEDWGRNISKTIMAKALESKMIIETLNAAARRPAKARFDIFRLGDGRSDSGYSVVTDEIVDFGV